MTLKSCRREIDMPVFDFSNTTEEKKACECTYTTFQSNENTASAKYPILVLDNTAKQWKYHSCGVFTNQIKRTAFEFTQEDGTVCADILRVDARFANLLRWLGENHINVRLSGELHIIAVFLLLLIHRFLTRCTAGKQTLHHKL